MKWLCESHLRQDGQRFILYAFCKSMDLNIVMNIICSHVDLIRIRFLLMGEFRIETFHPSQKTHHKNRSAQGSVCFSGAFGPIWTWTADMRCPWLPRWLCGDMAALSRVAGGMWPPTSRICLIVVFSVIYTGFLVQEVKHGEVQFVFSQSWMLWHDPWRCLWGKHSRKLCFWSCSHIEVVDQILVVWDLLKSWLILIPLCLCLKCFSGMYCINSLKSYASPGCAAFQPSSGIVFFGRGESPRFRLLGSPWTQEQCQYVFCSCSIPILHLDIIPLSVGRFAQDRKVAHWSRVSVGHSWKVSSLWLTGGLLQ